MTTLLAIDVTQIIVTSITGFFGLASLVVTIWLTARVAGYKKQVDGMKDELIQAVAGKGLAEGQLKGKADQKVIEKANQDDKDAAVNVALNTPVPESEKAIDVNIVDQTKPVEVTNKPKK